MDSHTCTLQREGSKPEKCDEPDSRPALRSLFRSSDNRSAPALEFLSFSWVTQTLIIGRQCQVSGPLPGPIPQPALNKAASFCVFPALSKPSGTVETVLFGGSYVTSVS